VIDSVSRTLWSVMMTPIPLLRRSRIALQVGDRDRVDAGERLVEQMAWRSRERTRDLESCAARPEEEREPAS
jgi:hypothetical protein